MNAIARFVRAVVATAAIVAIIGGLPVLLWLIGQQLFAGSWFIWSELGDLLSRPDDGRLLLTFVLMAAVVAWALLTYSLLAEFVAALTRQPAPRIDLPGFRASRALAALLVGTILGAGSAPAWAAPVVPTATAAPQLPELASTAEMHPAPERPDDTRQYLVKAGDTLWDVADDELGDPLRWREILRLSADRVQPDGGRVTESGLLRVGWLLDLPAEDTPGRANGSVIVRPGDTLTGIAARELGDPNRAIDIFELNHDRRQADGGHLESADLILPGWTLDLPDGPRADNTASPLVRPPMSPPAGPPRTPAWPPDVRVTPTPSPLPDDSGTLTTTAPPPSSTETTGPPAEREPTPGPSRAPAAPAPSSAVPSQDGDGGESHILVPVSIAASSVVLGGLVTALVLRRRRQFRYRRRGHRIAVPDERGGRVEWNVAQSAHEVDPTFLDTALRGLVLADWDSVDAPELRSVVLGPDHLLLTVRAPVLLPPPFTPIGHGEDWQLDTSAVLPLAPDEASEYCAPYPTLASIATDSHGDLLLADLEAIGVAHITGDADAAVGLLRHIAAELANAPWVDDTEVLLAGFGDELPPLNPDRLHVLPDLAAGIAAVTTRARQAEATLGQLDLRSVMQGRLQPLAPDAWVPVVLLATGPATDSDRAALERLAADIGGDRRRPVAVISAGIALTGQEIHISDDGALVMTDAGEGWIAASMSVTEASDYAAVLAPTMQPDVPVRRAADPLPWAIDMNEDGSLEPAAVPADVTVPAQPTDAAGPSAEGGTPPAVRDARTIESAQGGIAREIRSGEEAIHAPGAKHLDVRLDVQPPSGTEEPFTNGTEAASSQTEPDPHGPSQPIASTSINPAAVPRLAAVDRNDPDLDDDLRCWRTTETPELPLIGILGIPEVRTSGPVPRTRPSWWTEMLVYLALHPIGVTLDKALTDLWPDGKQLSDATVRHAFYGARRWAGRGLDGDPEQPFVSEMQRDGVYRMRGHLLDWDLFRRLRKRAQARLAAQHPGAVDDYMAALGLVRGPVLSPLRPHGYAWLTSHPDRLDLQIPGFVVDTAHELVDIALAAGDTARARRAAETARLVDPDVAFDRPLLDLMRVAHAEGQASEMERYAVMLFDAREPEDELPDGTFDVLNDLVPNLLRRHR